MNVEDLKKEKETLKEENKVLKKVIEEVKENMAEEGEEKAKRVDRSNETPEEKKERQKREKAARKAAKKAAEKERKKAKKAQKKAQKAQEKDEKQLPKKEEDTAEWYSQLIVKSGMIEYFDIKGCYILRPWSFQLWESIRDYIDGFIKKDGVQNCYFPLFVTKKRLEAEEDHIEGFAPEVAWVTKSGDKELAEPIALRPTSETIMYPAYAKWIRSYRDLPLRLNQWANVVRWELNRPQPFIRSREFLWQEGHSAYATKAEAEIEVMKILDLYARVYEDLLAIPVIKGRKTEKEKFAGGDYTTTVEAYVPISGRSVQGATSHHLGQNFSKMFNIEFFNEKKEKELVYQNSWGMTTRTIGVMVMVHGDNKGLVLPPRVAPIQVVVIPLVMKNKDYTAEQINEKGHELGDKLKAAGFRVEVDDREGKNPGWKYSEAEMRGITLRIEVGPRDIAKNQCVIVRRVDSKKVIVPLDALTKDVQAQLDESHKILFNNALEQRDERLKVVEQWDDFVPALDQKSIIMAPFCGDKACEGQIKKLSGEEASESEEGLSGSAKSLCVPFDQSLGGVGILGSKPCFAKDCQQTATSWTLFGRSY